MVKQINQRAIKNDKNMIMTTIRLSAKAVDYQYYFSDIVPPSTTPKLSDLFGSYCVA